jgi:hypothetical protein
LDSPKGEDGWPVYRVDYPCKCGHNDFRLVEGVVPLTDPEELKGMFCDYPWPKEKVKKVKKKHSPGLFDEFLKTTKKR